MSETNNETVVRSRATSTTSPSKAKLTPLVPGKEDPNRPLVELTHVEKHFGALHVLKDINLTVAKGEVLVVVGPSGSGKSTMCRTINRLETIDSGDIRIGGKLKVVGKPFTQEYYGVGIKKGDTQLATKINNAIVDMIQDGSWENAISDNTKGTNYTPDVRYNPPIPDEGEEA